MTAVAYAAGHTAHGSSEHQFYGGCMATVASADDGPANTTIRDFISGPCQALLA